MVFLVPGWRAQKWSQYPAILSTKFVLEDLFAQFRYVRALDRQTHVPKHRDHHGPALRGNQDIRSTESVSYRKRAYKDRLRECGATDEECDFIIGDGKKGTRIELNAMDSAQFVEWLERKFAEHGVAKVVPDKATLDAAYKRAILVKLANNAIGSVQAAWTKNGDDVSVPDDLERQVRDLVEGTSLSWDAAIMNLPMSQDPKPAQRKS